MVNNLQDMMRLNGKIYQLRLQDFFIVQRLLKPIEMKALMKITRILQ